MPTYTMTREDNIAFAKRNLVDSIWKEANIEGIGVTFPETKEIFEGRAVAGLSIDATVAINNLKHAWQFVLDNIDTPIDLAFVRQLNGIIGANLISYAGDLRMYDVSIGGTSWKPPIPNQDEAKEALSAMGAKAPSADSALDMFLWLCRSQLFSDGNKRTAQLAANKIMIEVGAGILAIPVEKKSMFEDELIRYYETGEASSFKSFLVENAIDGYDSPSFTALRERAAQCREAADALDAGKSERTQEEPSR